MARKISRIVNWNTWSVVELVDDPWSWILVFDKPNAEVDNDKYITVHFEGLGVRPVAIFEPTDRGWLLANEFCSAQIAKENR